MQPPLLAQVNTIEITLPDFRIPKFSGRGPALAVAMTLFAIFAGFAGGAFILGPVFSDETQAEIAAAQHAERFSPRTVDLTRDYPNPFVYRTRTPNFPESGPTGVAAAARSQALQSIASAPASAPSNSPPRYSAFAPENEADRGAWARQAQSEQRTVSRDRHTGVAY